MRIHWSLFLILSFLFVHHAPAASIYIDQMAEREAETRKDALISHGVNTTPGALLYFLTEGFTDSAIRRGLPENPPVKSSLINYAIQELGFRQSREAVPLLLEIAQGNPPSGARSVMQRDLEALPLDEADSRRENIIAVLRLNSLVALGYIGDHSAVPVIKEVMLEEQGNAFKSEGALALGELESPDALGSLVKLTLSVKNRELPAVYRYIFYLTGRNYGVTENTSPLMLEQKGRELWEWYSANASKFVPVRSEILRRRAEGLTVPDPPISTLRGALRATKDFDDYDKRYAARQRLKETAAGSIPQLRAIVLDPYEDTDIRLAALDWYAAHSPKKAEDDLEDLEEDSETPAIRQRARMLLEEIDRFKEELED